MQRKLAAILSADIVGYSGLMEADEAGTLARLQANRRDVFDPCVAKHGGRIVKLMGDGALIEFASVVAAVECAVAIQAAMAAVEPARDPEQRLRYRIGVNLGDVIIDGDDIYGEGVNVAARLQALAPVGGVALSRTVRDHIEGKVAASFQDLGEHAVKNIQRPVHVFALQPPGQAPGPSRKVEAAQRVSICVLPFTNMSGDPEQEYFSDGISEDIITDLSKVSALWVAARNTAFTFKGKHVDVPQVARQLKVGHVLEGSVRKAGGRVRITAQLIDAEGGHVWAERYDRDLSDIFALQDEISEAIVKVLKVKLLPEEKKAIEMRGTSSAEAYKYYLLARQFISSGNTSTRIYEAVIRLGRRAVEIDPAYAQAWAMIARAQERLRFQGHPDQDGSEAVERALALDDKLGEAHAVKGRIFDRQNRREDAAHEMEIALALAPDSHEVNLAMGSHLFVEGRLREAAQFYEKAAHLIETDCACWGMLTTVYRGLGDQEAALHAARQVVERASKVVAREPDNCTVISWLVGGLGLLGEAERVQEWIDRALILDPDDFNMRYNFACTFAQELNDPEAALDLLETSFNLAQQSSLDWIKVDPDMSSLRDHPRFKAMLAAAEARLAQAASA